ncbi:MAG: cupin domain-containing protein [Chloroflexota bacterium]|nr:cupin domain-containing protein [Chloroflexota bacterium]
MSIDERVRCLDLRSVFGIVATITTPAASTGGAYVEMDCTAEPGSKTLVHYHPQQSESYSVLEGSLEVFHHDTWSIVRSGETLTIPPGAVHGFRNTTDAPVRFLNRHEPALDFQAHLETLDHLVQRGRIRGTNDPRSLIYMSMSAVTYRPDVAVKPPQWVVNAMAFLGRRLGYRLTES